jgi:hypothetical protein
MSRRYSRHLDDRAQPTTKRKIPLSIPQSPGNQVDSLVSADCDADRTLSPLPGVLQPLLVGD